MTLDDFYFSYPGMFLIPVEHLGPQGMSPDFRALLRDRDVASDPWMDLFDDSFAELQRRMRDLADQAPGMWLPPRTQNVCIVTDPGFVRPFFQPLNKCSWLLYHSDFDPQRSHREFAMYVMSQTERYGFTQEILPALGCHLSYWLVRSEEEVEAFIKASHQATRPDAAVYRTIADSMDWIRSLYHQHLKKPVLAPNEPFITVPGSGLLIPSSQKQRYDGLIQQWSETLNQVVSSFFQTHGIKTSNQSRRVVSYLQESRPRLLLTGANNEVLWSYERPEETGLIEKALKGIPDTPAKSLMADLEVVAAKTEAVLSSLSDPEALPVQEDLLDQGGLTYVYVGRRDIAYNIHEKNMRRLEEPAPPAERQMIAARTVHEWCHLIVDAGGVPVAADKQESHQEATQELEALFAQVQRDLPAHLQNMVAPEVASLRSQGSPEKILVDRILARMSDWQCNVLYPRYLALDEQETYIRNNVYCLIREPDARGYLSRLARYVYERQYLKLSKMQDADAYFRKSTWFPEQYFVHEFLTEDLFEQLCQTVSTLTDSYAPAEGFFVS